MPAASSTTWPRCPTAVSWSPTPTAPWSGASTPTAGSPGSPHHGRRRRQVAAGRQAPRHRGLPVTGLTRRAAGRRLPRRRHLQRPGAPRELARGDHHARGWAANGHERARGLLALPPGGELGRTLVRPRGIAHRCEAVPLRPGDPLRRQRARRRAHARRGARHRATPAARGRTATADPEERHRPASGRREQARERPRRASQRSLGPAGRPGRAPDPGRREHYRASAPPRRRPRGPRDPSRREVDRDRPHGDLFGHDALGRPPHARR